MPRSKLIRTAGVAIALAMGLTACSLLIPDQDIGDVFGLDDRSVTLTAVDGGEITPGQFTSCDGVDGTHCAVLEARTFADPDLPDIATSLVRGLDVDAGLQATLTPSGVLPEQLTVSKLAVSLILTDLETSDTVAFDAAVTASPPVVFASQGDGTYVASDVTPLGLTVSAGSDDLGTVKDILDGGGDNSASGVVVLTVVESGPTEIDVVLTSDETIVSF
jgi:hypothetical protein